MIETFSQIPRNKNSGKNNCSESKSKVHLFDFIFGNKFNFEITQLQKIYFEMLKPQCRASDNQENLDSNNNINKLAISNSNEKYPNQSQPQPAPPLPESSQSENLNNLLKEILPTSGLVFSENTSMSEVLCAPKILPVKSLSLMQLTEQSKKLNEQQH